MPESFKTAPILVNWGRKFVSLQKRTEHLRRHIAVLNEILGREYEAGRQVAPKSWHLQEYRAHLAGLLEAYKRKEKLLCATISTIH